jgi:phospholipid/cholesterol/gamma-HCH transport system substrate-binding protein
VSELTRGQRMRLGGFLLVAFALLAGTLVVMVGQTLLERRQEYRVVFQGGVGGLEPGSTVKLNGIAVGRVESVRIDPEDVAAVEVMISLKDQTPVKEDTVATVGLQGITGLKYIELSGGTNAARTREPGETIPSAGSLLDSLTDKATSIADKLDVLVGNLVLLTGQDNALRIGAILADIEALTGMARALVSDNAHHIDAILTNVEVVTGDAELLVVEAQATLQEARRAIERVSNWVDPAEVSGLLANVDSTVRTVERRLGKAELGAAIAEATALMGDGRAFVTTAEVTLLRAREDLLRVLDELIVAVENFSDFTAILRDNPAALISGRSEKDRDLP